MPRKLILLLIAFELACATAPLSPPEGTRRVSPPAYLRAEYEELKKCVGITYKSFDDVKFYLVPGEGAWFSGSVYVVGQYWQGGDIFILEGARDEKWVWLHELTHYLLDPIQGHPSPPFDECEYR